MANRDHARKIEPGNLEAINEFRKEARRDQISKWVFIEDYAHIKNKVDEWEGVGRGDGEEADIPGIIKIQFNDTQRIYHSLVQERLAKSLPLDDVVLKSRQVGQTTDLMTMVFADAYLVDALHAMVMAQDEGRAQKILDMAELMHDKLPDHLKLPLDKCNEGEISWLYSRSRILIANPKTKESQRGDTDHWQLYDEAAFYDDLKGIMEARQAALIKGRRRRRAVLSTANGTAPYYHDIYWAAKEGEIAMRAVFLSWLLDRRCNFPFRDDSERSKFLDIVRAKDKYIWEKAQKYKMTPEQMHFYWYQLYSEYRGNRLITCQEFPCDDLEAFIASGTPVFPLDICQIYQNMSREGDLYNPEIAYTWPTGPGAPRKRISDFLPGGHLLRNKNTYLEVWDEPRPQHRYLITADVAEGIQGRDYSTAQVWDIDTFCLVAEVHGWLRATPLAIIMIVLGYMYNHAILCPENKFYGEAVIDALKERKYWNIWHSRKPVGAGYEVTNRLGFSNDATSRPIMINKGVEIFMQRQDDPNFIPSRALVDELMKFTIDNSIDRPQAKHGAHDDRVLTMLEGIQVIVQYLNLSPGSNICTVAPDPSRPSHQAPRRVKRNLIQACGLQGAVSLEQEIPPWQRAD